MAETISIARWPFLATHQMVPLTSFLAGAGVLMLGLFFYISLEILLGVPFDSCGLVLGIVFRVIFGSLLIRNFAPQIL